MNITQTDQLQGILTSIDEGIYTITLNRPDKRNAVDGPTADALRRAFIGFEENDALKVAVLCGTGGNFCSGADLEAIGDEAPATAPWARPVCTLPNQ